MSDMKLDPAAVHAAGDHAAFDRAAENAVPMELPASAPPAPSWPALTPLGKLGPWLTERPPARRWLLKTSPPVGTPEGLLPLGTVAILAGASAAGKSWALTQLALSVATGRLWLNTYAVATPGNVLLALGEEPEDEARRRLYHAAGALGLTPEERERAEARLFPWPLAGKPVALTCSAEEAEAGGLPETYLAGDLRKLLAGLEWSLIVVDPLSRFAGPDVEIDNAQATRFVQVLETLTELPGKPTVLFSHHTTKAARADGALGGNAAAARGSSALTDAVRWQANLVPHGKLPEAFYPAAAPRLLTFTVSKVNGSREPADLVLARGDHGVLRPAGAMEAKRYADAKADTKAAAKTEKANRAARSEPAETPAAEDPPLSLFE